MNEPKFKFNEYATVIKGFYSGIKVQIREEHVLSAAEVKDISFFGDIIYYPRTYWREYTCLIEDRYIGTFSRRFPEDNLKRPLK